MTEEEAEDVGRLTRPPTPPPPVAVVALAEEGGGGCGGGAGDEEVCGWVQDTVQDPLMSIIWCTERTRT